MLRAVEMLRRRPRLATVAGLPIVGVHAPVLGLVVRDEGSAEFEVGDVVVVVVGAHRSPRRSEDCRYRVLLAGEHREIPAPGGDTEDLPVGRVRTRRDPPVTGAVHLSHAAMLRVRNDVPAAAIHNRRMLGPVVDAHDATASSRQPPLWLWFTSHAT